MSAVGQKRTLASCQEADITAVPRELTRVGSGAAKLSFDVWMILQQGSNWLWGGLADDRRNGR